MYFQDEVLESLPEEPNAGIVKICNYFFLFWDKEPRTKQSLILETYALISTYSETNNLEIKVPHIDTYSTETINQARSFIEQLREEFEPKAITNQFVQYKSTFATRLGTAFYYEFPEGDLKRIQKLISELRDLISESQEIEEDHKSRLLKKLEKVQSELHKKVSDLDRFWGFFLDASIVLGQAGENVKPMVDRIRELVSIIWPTQTRAYELPSSLPFKLLGPTEGDSSKDDKS